MRACVHARVCALAEGAYSEARSGYGMSCFIVFLFAPCESGSLAEPGARQCRSYTVNVWFLGTAGVSGHRGILRFLASELYQDLQWSSDQTGASSGKGLNCWKTESTCSPILLHFHLKMLYLAQFPVLATSGTPAPGVQGPLWALRARAHTHTETARAYT